MEVELLKKYGSVSPGKIENLDGTTETVDFRFSTAIRFYHNMEDADFPLHWHAPGEIISPIEGTYTVTIAGKTVDCWGGKEPNILVVAPPRIKEGFHDEVMGNGCVEKSKGVAGWYKIIAGRNNVHFLDAEGCEFNQIDFMHLTRKGHAQLAEKLAELVPTLL